MGEVAIRPAPLTSEAPAEVEAPSPAPIAKRLVIVLTKATLDEAYPAFILANTGAASGMEVDLYFTFWGMKLLDKRTAKKTKLSPVGNPAMGMPNLLAVLPGATATDFWDAGGLPVHNLPSEIVMTTENLVDAALSGLDQGELVTIPALPDIGEWDRFEAARRDMSTRLSRTIPAARYGVNDAKAS